MKYLLLAIYLLGTLHCIAQTRDTFELYFPFNKSTITKETEEHIDALIFKDTLIHGDKLIVLGYADYVGGKGHNDSLSYWRARAVRDYLLTYGFDKKDISVCIGKGEIEHAGIKSHDGYAPDRKVQIVIDHSARSDTPPLVVPKSSAGAVKAPGKIVKKVDSLPRTFQLNNIFFKPNDNELYAYRSRHDLDTLVQFLKKHTDVSIGIFVDMRGWDSQFGFAPLSENRAGAIYWYLRQQKKIPEGRLWHSFGFLNAQPGEKFEIPPPEKQTNPRVIIEIHKRDTL